MQFLNKKIQYGCIKTGDKLKINGNLIIENSFITFSGNFNTLKDDYCGDFIYSEKNDGNINISTNNISPKNITFAYQMVLDCVQEIKSKLTSFNQE